MKVSHHLTAHAYFAFLNPSIFTHTHLDRACVLCVFQSVRSTKRAQPLDADEATVHRDARARRDLQSGAEQEEEGTSNLVAAVHAHSGGDNERDGGLGWG